MKNRVSKVIFAVNTSYPTQKAYGVTIGRSAEAMNELGFETEIWSAYFEGKDEFGNEVKALFGRKTIAFINYIYSHSEKLAFLIQSLLSLLLTLNRLMQSRGSYLLWSRDLPTVVLAAYLRKSSFHLLEIHHPLKKYYVKILDRVIKKANFEVGFISENLRRSNLSIYKRQKSFLLPMAAPKEFYSPLNAKVFPEILSVCYVGKGFSSGHENGLKEVLASIKECQEKNLKLQFKFIGIEEEYQRVLKQMKNNYEISDDYLEFVGHVNHSNIPDIMRDFDLGLVPYSSNPYNDSRFPIKLVEYCASGVIPVISNTSNHKALIGSDAAIFYDAESRDSVCKTLGRISFDYDLNSIRKNGQEWAKQYTYQRRVVSALIQFGLFK